MVKNQDELQKEFEEQISELMKERRKRLNEAIQTNNLTLIALEKLIGVAKSSIQRYLTGETVKIPIDFFEKVAHVTNTPVEYLTCFDSYKKENAPTETNRDELTKVIRQLTEDNENRVKDYADLLLLKQKSQS